MRLTYIPLYWLGISLNEKLKEWKIGEVFSQARNELIIEFFSQENQKELYLITQFHPGKEVLFFKKDFQRSKKNFFDFFQSIHGQKVEKVFTQKGDRILWITLSNGYTLMFKLFGSKPNVILSQHGIYLDAYKKGVYEMLEIKPKEGFAEMTVEDETLDEKALKKKFPFIDDSFLIAHKNSKMDLKDFLLSLKEPKRLFSEKSSSGKFQLQPFSTTGSKDLGTNIIQGFTNWAFQVMTDETFDKEKEKINRVLLKDLNNQKVGLKKAEEGFEKKSKENKFEKWANLLMANLHRIQKGMKEIEVEDLYQGGKIIIKINPELSPQEQAEKWYRKAKNHHLEFEKLSERIGIKKEAIDGLEKKLSTLQKITSMKDLRAEFGIDTKGSKQDSKEHLPFHVHNYNGYEIRVGKSGSRNDEMLSRYSSKNDIWLHVKDAAGSHVLIVNQGKKAIPGSVLEFAASQAIKNSKKKNEQHVPVIHTERKYVRKRKGDPPGRVVVDRENIIFANP